MSDQPGQEGDRPLPLLRLVVVLLLVIVLFFGLIGLAVTVWGPSSAFFGGKAPGAPSAQRLDREDIHQQGKATGDTQGNPGAGRQEAPAAQH